jgi:hypothetical protein
MHVDFLFEFNLIFFERTLVPEIFQVYQRNHSKSVEDRRKIRKVQSSEPLAESHLLKFVRVFVQELLGIFQRQLWLVSVPQEMTLQLGHGKLFLGEALCKLSRLFMSRWIEFQEQPLHLHCARVVQLDLEVASARS